MNQKDIVISIKEASEILGTSKGEVYKLINSKKISSVKENHRTFIIIKHLNLCPI